MRHASSNSVVVRVTIGSPGMKAVEELAALAMA
jgi:hypothetical protein